MSALGERVVDFLVEHTHSRYVGNRDEAYTSSYRVIRLVVGFLGVSLPIVFFFVEGFVLQGGVHVRGSLSAYYHTSMQDIFVGGLCIIGLLLSTYMAGEWKSLDFGASLIAGVAVLGSSFSLPRGRVSQSARQPAAAFPSRPGAPSSSKALVSTRRQ